MSHLPIWYLGKISENKIDIANQELRKIETKKATMGPNGESLDVVGRDTTVAFADFNHWLGLEMFEFAKNANKNCNWDFDINNHEALQYAEYGPKQHYHWHIDTFPLSGKIVDRKVTVVCLINNPSATLFTFH